MQQFVVLALRLLVPMPPVLKGLDLRLARDPFRRLEEQVVIALRVKTADRDKSDQPIHPRCAPAAPASYRRSRVGSLK